MDHLPLHLHVQLGLTNQSSRLDSVTDSVCEFVWHNRRWDFGPCETHSPWDETQWRWIGIRSLGGDSVPWTYCLLTWGGDCVVLGVPGPVCERVAPVSARMWGGGRRDGGRRQENRRKEEKGRKKKESGNWEDRGGKGAGGEDVRLGMWGGWLNKEWMEEKEGGREEKGGRR